MLLVLATAYGRGAQLQVRDPQHVESLILIIPCVAIALKVITQCYGRFIQFLAVAVYGLILCVGFGTRYDMAAEFRPWRTLSLSAIAKAQGYYLEGAAASPTGQPFDEANLDRALDLRLSFVRTIMRQAKASPIGATLSLAKGGTGFRFCGVDGAIRTMLVQKSTGRRPLC